MTDVGLEVVRSLYQKMMIDQEWSIWHQRGFTWWGYRLAQHIWADPCFEEQGCVISRIHARTDLLDDFTGSDDQYVNLMGPTPFLTSLSGPIRDPSNPSHVQLAANIRINTETADCWAHAFATVAIMQAEEAHRVVELLAKDVKARPAFSAHPKLGFRND
jgi:hypothetical protein